MAANANANANTKAQTNVRADYDNLCRYLRRFDAGKRAGASGTAYPARFWREYLNLLPAGPRWGDVREMVDGIGDWETFSTIACYYSEDDFEVANPAALETVEAFEAEHGIRLPEDYRRFLLLVGEGMPGPGVAPLFTLEEVGNEIAQSAEWNEVESPAQPFPLTAACSAYARDTDDYAAPEYITAHGAIAIADYGCAMVAYLIVSGPERGNVWICDEGNWQPFNAHIAPQYMAWHDPPRPAPHPTDRMSFIEWYSDWLAEVVQRVRHENAESAG